VELIDFPDGVGPCIGPITSKKLYGDFTAFARKAKAHYANPTPPSPPSKPISKKAKGKEGHINQAGLDSARSLAKALGGTTATAASDELGWMREVYDDFRIAFKLASNGGFVVFC
jgi:hypothetical protein